MTLDALACEVGVALRLSNLDLAAAEITRAGGITLLDIGAVSIHASLPLVSVEG